MTGSPPSPYRFVIVLMVAAAAFLANFVIFQMAGLAPQIIEAASLDPARFGLVIGISILTAAVFGMPLGALGDRVGVKPVVAAAIVVTLVGSIGRYLATPSFGGYLFWMFLVGATNAALNANFIKVLGVWLPPSGIGVGVGCYLAGIGLGQTISIASGSRFASMGSAYLFAIIVSVVVLVLWLLFVKNPPNLPKSQPLPMSRTLRFVMGQRDIWVGGIGIFFLLGTYVAATSFAASFLTGVKNAAPDKAVLTASAIAFCMLLGGLVSDKTARLIGSSRIFLLFSGLVAAGGTLLALFLPFGALSVIGLGLMGLSVGVYCSFILSLPMLLDYVGPVYAGSAGGLISTLMSTGGFALPYLFPALAGGDLGRLMVWLAVGYVLMGAVTLALPELIKRPVALSKTA
jgi:NNP family nitrate/nitrite transporter-like MFS transporter